MGKNVLERMKENDSEHKIAMFKVKQQQDYLKEYEEEDRSISLFDLIG